KLSIRSPFHTAVGFKPKEEEEGKNKTFTAFVRPFYAYSHYSGFIVYAMKGRKKEEEEEEAATIKALFERILRFRKKSRFQGMPQNSSQLINANKNNKN
ncbi:unnamed protein product, partial [Heterotrigona itama]